MGSISILLLGDRVGVMGRPVLEYQDGWLPGGAGTGGQTGLAGGQLRAPAGPARQSWGWPGSSGHGQRAGGHEATSRYVWGPQTKGGGGQGCTAGRDSPPVALASPALPPRASLLLGPGASRLKATRPPPKPALPSLPKQDQCNLAGPQVSLIRSFAPCPGVPSWGICCPLSPGHPNSSHVSLPSPWAWFPRGQPPALARLCSALPSSPGGLHPPWWLCPSLPPRGALLSPPRGPGTRSRTGLCPSKITRPSWGRAGREPQLSATQAPGCWALSLWCPSCPGAGLQCHGLP